MIKINPIAIYDTDILVKKGMPFVLKMFSKINQLFCKNALYLSI